MKFSTECSVCGGGNNPNGPCTCAQTKMSGLTCGCCSSCDKNKESPDSNVEFLRDLLLKRSEVGLQKYGITTERDDLSLRDWLRHALEETLDQAVYLQAAIVKLDAMLGVENEHY